MNSEPTEDRVALSSRLLAGLAAILFQILAHDAVAAEVKDFTFLSSNTI